MRDAQERLIHDLRNAATVLRAAAMQLQGRDGAVPAEASTQLLEMIERRSEMVLGLLDELSELPPRDEEDDDTLTADAAAGSGSALPRVALAEMCREALERRTPDGTTVTLLVPEDAIALGEPMRVVRILDNLLTNAFRYGGPHVTVTARRAGSFVTLEVHDDGPGVAPEIAGSVFDAHVRGPRSEELGGSGLGLAIVRELCATMGGTVTYRHRAGASFTVTLPAAPDTVPAGPQTLPAQEPAGQAHRPAWSPAAELLDALGPVPTETAAWRARLSTGRRTSVA